MLRRVYEPSERVSINSLVAQHGRGTAMLRPGLAYCTERVALWEALGRRPDQWQRLLHETHRAVKAREVGEAEYEVLDAELSVAE